MVRPCFRQQQSVFKVFNLGLRVIEFYSYFRINKNQIPTMLFVEGSKARGLPYWTQNKEIQTRKRSTSSASTEVPNGLSLSLLLNFVLNNVSRNFLCSTKRITCLPQWFGQQFLGSLEFHSVLAKKHQVIKCGCLYKIIYSSGL